MRVEKCIIIEKKVRKLIIHSLSSEYIVNGRCTIFSEYYSIWAATLSTILHSSKRSIMPAWHHSDFLTAVCPLTESTIQKTIYSNAESILERKGLLVRLHSAIVD